MRKFFSVVMLCVAVLSVSETAKAVGTWDELIRSFADVAYKIVLNNKPAFETKLSKKERMVDDWDSGIFYFRVWAKDTTLVVGSGDKKKHFYTDYFQTRDPMMVFAGGVRVGATTSVLEKFFGMPLNKISVDDSNESTQSGEILYKIASDAEPLVRISHNDGKITEIEMYLPDMERPSLTKKAAAFIEQKKTQMGLSEGWM